MEVIYYIIIIVIGSIMGSFFHVVSTRLSNGQSIISPPSHCHICKRKLKWYELIPILSFLIQKGKSRCCGNKLPFSYLVAEVMTAVLYAVCYHSYGFTPKFFIGLVFISGLIIIIISDIEYMIILDEVLYVCSFLIIILNFIFYGIIDTSEIIANGVISFVSMYIIKLIGDFIFKRESLGGGDIKLLFFFGLCLGYALSITSIFLATFIAFPVALFVMMKNKDHLIPFGPFLSMAAILLFISKIEFMDIINYLVS